MERMPDLGKNFMIVEHHTASENLTEFFSAFLNNSRSSYQIAPKLVINATNAPNFTLTSLFLTFPFFESVV